MPQNDNPLFFKDFRMRNRTSACALYLVVMALPALAQAPPAPSADMQLVAPPDWAFNDLACAPALGPVKRDKKNEPPIRVVGVQDPAIRELLGPGDTLVVSAGSNAGIQTGQRFFVRRFIPAVATFGATPRATIHTSGWSRFWASTRWSRRQLSCTRATAFCSTIISSRTWRP